MASLIPRGKKAYAIQYVDRRRRRRTIGLGRTSKRTAHSVLRHVENLVAAHLVAGPPDPETARWLGQIGDQLRNRLAEHGLIPGVDPTCPLLSHVCRNSINARRSGCSAPVLARLEHTRDLILERFGDVPVDQVTEADAKAWRAELLGQGLADATVRKRCSDARSFFGWAVSARIIDKNPFAAVPCTTTPQTSPHYVGEETVRAVMDKLPDARWRLLVAMGRWGGLRIPSEVRAMTWADVLWDRGRLRVESPKTEDQGKGERQVPLFPELVEPLQEWLEQCPEGQVEVFPQIGPRTTGGSMRNVLINAIRRAGLEPWPNLWRTLRASRQTDLEARFPIHVVCHWLGNTTQVASLHYLRVHEQHWSAASGAASEPDGALHEALHRESSHAIARARED